MKTLRLKPVSDAQDPAVWMTEPAVLGGSTLKGSLVSSFGLIGPLTPIKGLGFLAFGFWGLSSKSNKAYLLQGSPPTLALLQNDC